MRVFASYLLEAASGGARRSFRKIFGPPGQAGEGYTIGMNEHSPAKEGYGRLAPVYDRRWRSYEDVTHGAALDAARGRRGEKLLDVACGTGELERRLLARCPEV